MGRWWIVRSALSLMLTVLTLWGMPLVHAEENPSGRIITLETAYGTHFDAYAAGPEDAALAVLLLHDRFGMSPQLREWTERFAGLGYHVLAIDLYDGRRAEKWKHATSIMKSIDPVWSEANVAAGLKYLKPDERKVVMLGWDYGGTQALLATLAAPAAVAATVVYYPTALVTDQLHLQSIAKPVLVIVAERDEELGPEQILAFKDGMSKTRVDFNVMGLDAPRAFMNPLSGRYDADAANTVWDVTQDFLARYAVPAAPPAK